MNELSTVDSKSGTALDFSNINKMNQLTVFAKFMSDGKIMLPKHLRGQSTDCMAICMQAMQWGMNPFVVAQKTHVVSGTLGYEAQLVAAVVQASTAVQGGFSYEYSDGWERLEGKSRIAKVKKSGQNGSYEVDSPQATWDKGEEAGLWVRVGAKRRGHEGVDWGKKLSLANVLVRNSPEWVSDPAQQLSYLAVKKWCRLYAPQVLLGVYTTDEIQVDSAPQQAEVHPSDDVNEMLAVIATQSLVEDSGGDAVQPEPEQVDSQREIYNALIEVMKNATTLEGIEGVDVSIATKLTGEAKGKAVSALEKRSNQLRFSDLKLVIAAMVKTQEAAEIQDRINRLTGDEFTAAEKLLNERIVEIDTPTIVEE